MSSAAAFDRESYRRALARAAAGGLLFGMPLLYTMEVWWSGFVLPWWKLLVLLAVSALFVFAFSRLEGFRRNRTPGQAAWDSVIDFGLGAVIAAAALLLLGRLDGSSSLREWAGMVTLEAIPIAIGASVARSLLGERDPDGEGFPRSTLGYAVTAAGGALFFALNVAPTEEPMMLGIENPWWLAALLVAATVPVTLGIVFYADFRGSQARQARDEARSPLATPLGETVVSLAVAFAVAAMLLWVFGRIGTDIGVGAAIAQIASLGVVAAVGAAAARLLL